MDREKKYRVIGSELQVQKADESERLKLHNGFWLQKVPTVVIESEYWECHKMEKRGGEDLAGCGKTIVAR